MRFILYGMALITTLALCAGVSSALGIVGDISYMIGYNSYRNTSPPMTSTHNNVTLALAHSRYLTVETFTVTLSNHSGAPIYLPVTSDLLPATGEYLPATSDFLNTTAVGNRCLALETAFLSAQGWRSLGRGCDWSPVCPGGATTTPRPALLIIAPGESVTFALYNGESTTKPWTSGVYRFSVLYSRTPFQVPRYWRQPLAIPQSVTLSTPPVTLTRAWWYSAQYHHSSSPCPAAA